MGHARKTSHERGTAGHELYLGMIGSLEAMKDMIERGEKPESRFDITAFMIGTEWCLITMPQEPFCEYELWVDENAPFDHTMVFGYTNGQMGYVPTDKALARGGKGGYLSQHSRARFTLRDGRPVCRRYRRQDSRCHCLPLEQELNLLAKEIYDKT